MNAFLSAIAATIIISVASWAILGQKIQTSSESEFSTPFVRLDQSH